MRLGRSSRSLLTLRSCGEIPTGKAGALSAPAFPARRLVPTGFGRTHATTACSRPNAYRRASAHAPFLIEVSLLQVVLARGPPGVASAL